MGLRRLLIVFILLVAIPALGKPSIDKWIGETGIPLEDQLSIQQQVETLVSRAQKDGAPSMRNLRKMFRRVQRTVLKEYVAYSDFSVLFTQGKFDCLTATTLYAHLLQSLEYQFEVIETNYHIFIVVQTVDGEILLETTDPVGGFVTDAKLIAARTGNYRLNELQPVPGAYAYRYECNLYQRVSIEQLSGLLQFNRAVKAYNNGDWTSCANSLALAHERYANPRNRELCDILVRTLLDHKEIPAEVRHECMSRLQPVITDGTVSSLN